MEISYKLLQFKHLDYIQKRTFTTMNITKIYHVKLLIKVWTGEGQGSNVIPWLWHIQILTITWDVHTAMVWNPYIVLVT